MNPSDFPQDFSRIPGLISAWIIGGIGACYMLRSYRRNVYGEIIKWSPLRLAGEAALIVLWPLAMYVDYRFIKKQPDKAMHLEKPDSCTDGYQE